MGLGGWAPFHKFPKWGCPTLPRVFLREGGLPRQIQSFGNARQTSPLPRPGLPAFHYIQLLSLKPTDGRHVLQVRLVERSGERFVCSRFSSPRLAFPCLAKEARHGAPLSWAAGRPSL